MKKLPFPLMYIRVTAQNNCYIEAVKIKNTSDIPKGVKIDFEKKIFTVEGYTGYGPNIDRLVEYPFGKFLRGDGRPHAFLGIFEPGNPGHIKKLVRYADDKANRGLRD